jgi:hypothetical protein
MISLSDRCAGAGLDLAAADRQALADYERQRDLIRDRTEQVAKKHHAGVFVWGRPGTSKTYTVVETLNTLNVSFQVWNARISPMGLWMILRDGPDQVVVVDDVNTLFSVSSTAAMQVLLAALQSKPGEARTVSYRTKDEESVSSLREV